MDTKKGPGAAEYTLILILLAIVIVVILAAAGPAIYRVIQAIVAGIAEL